MNKIIFWLFAFLALVTLYVNSSASVIAAACNYHCSGNICVPGGNNPPDTCTNDCSTCGNHGGGSGGSNPIGYFDAATCSNLAGWTCDQDSYTTPLTVKVYKDGPVGTGTLVGQATANLTREAGVANQCGGNAQHGFSVDTFSALKDGANHSLYVYGVNTGGGSDTLLSQSPRSVNCAATAPPTPTSPTTAKIVYTNIDYANNTTSLNIMNSDGSNNSTLATGVAHGTSISLDGTTIAYSCFDITTSREHICLINSDGTGKRQLTTNADYSSNSYPEISADKSKIVYLCANSSETKQICVMNSDGTGKTRLTTDMNSAKTFASFSLDKKKIVYQKDSNVFIMNSDGTGQTQLTNPSDTVDCPFFGNCTYTQPTFSSDFSKIYYHRSLNGEGANGDGISVMNLDGTNKHSIYREPVDMAGWVIIAPSHRSNSFLFTMFPNNGTGGSTTAGIYSLKIGETNPTLVKALTLPGFYEMGVNAWYEPALSPLPCTSKTNMSVVCDQSGTKATFSWDSIPNAYRNILRIDKNDSVPSPTPQWMTVGDRWLWVPQPTPVSDVNCTNNLTTNRWECEVGITPDAPYLGWSIQGAREIDPSVSSNCQQSDNTGFTCVAGVATTPTPTITPTPTTIPQSPACPAGKPSRSIGNANCDDYVNLADFQIWRNEYTGVDVSVRDADFDDNTRVALADFQIWRTTYTTPATTPTPTITPGPVGSLPEIGCTYLSSWGQTGTGNGQFMWANDGVIDSNHNVYIVDYSNARIQKFSSNGTYISQFGTSGSGDGQFHSPTTIAADSNNNLYVVDSENNRIQKFDSNGNFIKKWNTATSASDLLDYVDSIAIDQADNVYVGETNSTTNGGRILVYNTNGDYIRTIGTSGTGAGQISWTNGMVVDSNNNLFVVNSSEGVTMQHYKTDGTFVAEWSSQASTISGPDIDSSGNIFAAMGNDGLVRKFSPTGEVLGTSGGIGTGYGQFTRPTKIMFEGSTMYVIEGENNRIQKFSCN